MPTKQSHPTPESSTLSLVQQASGRRIPPHHATGRFQAGWPRHTHTHTSFKPDLAGKCTGEKSLCTSIRNKGSLVNVSPSPSSCHLVNGSNPKESLWCQPTQCTPSTAQDTSGVFGGERITVQELNY